MGGKPKNRAIKFKQSALGILYSKFSFKMQLLGKRQCGFGQMGHIFPSLSIKINHFYFRKLKIAVSSIMSCF